MLVRVFPEQVAEYWEFFAPMIAQSMPRELAVSRELLTNILTSILLDEAQVWVFKEKEDIKGMVLTAVEMDKVARLRHLLVYAIFALANLGLEDWKSGLTTLRGFAEHHKCSSIRSFVNAQDYKYQRFLKMLGGDLDSILVTF